MTATPDNLPALAGAVVPVVAAAEGTASRALRELQRDRALPSATQLTDDFMLTRARTLRRLHEDDLVPDSPTTRVLFQGPTHAWPGRNEREETHIVLFAVEQVPVGAAAHPDWVFSVWSYNVRDPFEMKSVSNWRGYSSDDGLAEFRWYVRNRVEYPGARLIHPGVSNPDAGTVRAGFRRRLAGRPPGESEESQPAR